MNQEGRTASTLETRESAVSLCDVCVKRGQFILDHISLNIMDGERFCVLGKTGAGKTVLLETIAGRLREETGEVLLFGHHVRSIKPQERGIGFVYQDYALFPNLTVKENIAFGPVSLKRPPDEIERDVRHMLDIFNIGRIQDQYPHQISGGEAQRTALARAIIQKPRLLLLDEPFSALDRAIIQKPRLLLLDEPFSALDRATREDMYRHFDRIWRTIGCTILFVTHDFHEAIRFADRVAVLLDGKLRLVASASTLLQGQYEDDVSSFLGLKVADRFCDICDKGEINSEQI
ncbi:MAG TPA: ATP-binding cassette domain-containing protein [Bacillota bacterium]|nr:ATP-binding cassette domain-containing protein [Bacillota bacterium]